jgi:hypothetical protein
MKTELRNYSKLAIVALALTLAFTTTALANGGDKDNKPATTEFKFIGNVENQPVFELNLISVDDEYTVTFRDDAGNVLYNAAFKGAVGLTKKFLLKSSDISDVDENITVIIKSKKTGSYEAYTINRKHTFLEETVISKVK